MNKVKVLKIYKENDEYVIERINEFNHSFKHYFITEEGLKEGIDSYIPLIKGQLTQRSFDAVLRKVMDKYNQGKIDSFRDYLATALTNKIEELELRRMKDKAKQNIKAANPNKQPDNNNKEDALPFYNWLDK